MPVQVKTHYIFYKRAWGELFPQLAELNKVGSPYFERTSDYSTNNYVEPIEWQPTEQDAVDRFCITRGWLERNVLPGNTDNNIIVFHVPTPDWKGGADNAHCYGGYGKPTIITVHSEQGEMLWNNPTFLNKGFFERTQHEFGHGACDQLGIVDKVHEIEARGGLWKKEFYQHLGLMPSGAVQKIQDELFMLLNRAINWLEGEIRRQRLINAIIQKESTGNDWAIGDKDLVHKAYGPMQIRQPAVDDVNNAKGWTYKAEDMLGNRDLSIKYFNVYINELYATEARLGRPVTDEDRARIWNGGPEGYKRASTLGYWEDIKRILKTI